MLNPSSNLRGDDSWERQIKRGRLDETSMGWHIFMQNNTSVNLAPWHLQVLTVIYLLINVKLVNQNTYSISTCPSMFTRLKHFGFNIILQNSTKQDRIGQNRIHSWTDVQIFLNWKTIDSHCKTHLALLATSHVSSPVGWMPWNMTHLFMSLSIL